MAACQAYDREVASSISGRGAATRLRASCTHHQFCLDTDSLRYYNMESLNRVPLPFSAGHRRRIYHTVQQCKGHML